MRNRNTSILVRIFSILFLSATIILVIVSLIGYSRQRNDFPAGMTIGGVPVGGLSTQEASERVLLVYSTPVEAQYGDAIIHISPPTVGFELDIEIDDGRSRPFTHWRLLLGRLLELSMEPGSEPIAVPLRATISEEVYATTCKMRLPPVTTSRLSLPSRSQAALPLHRAVPGRSLTSTVLCS